MKEKTSVTVGATKLVIVQVSILFSLSKKRQEEEESNNDLSLLESNYCKTISIALVLLISEFENIDLI